MYFEDVHEGETFESPPRRVTQDDVERFASLTGDRNPVHLDEDYAKGTPFGRRIAHGMLTLSLGLGQWSSAGITNDSLVALVELRDVRFLLPVFPGDTVQLKSRLDEKRALRSKPDSGLAVYEHTLWNGKGEVVLRYHITILLKRRDPLPAA